MGFALWIEGDLAWAQGVHEYRPLGAAVISSHDLFRHRDFGRARQAPPRSGPHYIGLFASLNELNAQLRSRANAKTANARGSHTPAWI